MADEMELAGCREGDSDLPEGWVSVSLGDIALTRKGKLPKDLREQTFAGSVPYIDIVAFERGNIRRFADSQSTTLVDCGDILVVWDGARCGLVGMAGEHGALGSTIAALDSPVMDSTYVAKFLQSQYHTINSGHRGSGIPHVDPGVFWSLSTPIPPLAEQKRIVAKVEELLAQVNAARDRLAKVPAMIKRFRQSVLAAACSGRLTADWRENHPDAEPASELLKRILAERRRKWEEAELAKMQASGKPPKDDKWKSRYKGPVEHDQDDLPDLPDDWLWGSLDALNTRIGDVDHKMPRAIPDGIPYISTKDFCGRDEIAYSSAKRISRSDFDALSRKIRPEQGDLLMSRYGTVGEVRKVTYDDPFQASYSIAIIKSLGIKEVVDYLDVALRSHVLQRQVQAGVRASSQPDVGLDSIRRFAVPLPPLPEQEEIVRRVEALCALADGIEKSLRAATIRTEKLTQAILAKAFRGELVPTEAELARQQGREYEPASVLLARIRQERAEQETSKAKRGRQ